MISAAAMVLARNASRTFSRRRASPRHRSPSPGDDPLAGDIQRAAFMSSPHVKRDPFVCGDYANWTAGMNALAGVQITKDGSVSDSDSGNLGRAPTTRCRGQIIIGGAFSTTEQFAVRNISPSPAAPTRSACSSTAAPPRAPVGRDPGRRADVPHRHRAEHRHLPHRPVPAHRRQHGPPRVRPDQRLLGDALRPRSHRGPHHSRRAAGRPREDARQHLRLERAGHRAAGQPRLAREVRHPQPARARPLRHPGGPAGWCHRTLSLRRRRPDLAQPAWSHRARPRRAGRRRQRDREPHRDQLQPGPLEVSPSTPST